ncbi:MAG: hypothetical protein A2Y38_19085 [Spirochaetes bacterium GWB1_59_5]|nr:MAG: hypothetical protein A2Y38_19085 [Spirochaetes bacterium GWB1_59_5]
MMEPISIALGLAQFAPSLLRFFGAGEKSAAIAEKVVGLAQTVTGAPNGEAALAALQQNQTLAQEFNLAVLSADTELEQAFLADRKDARARDAAMRQAGFSNKRADLMVIGDVIGLVACLVVLALFRKEMPGEVVSLLSMVASIFGLCLRDAHQFEFGSSRGSKNKDALMMGDKNQ